MASIRYDHYRCGRCGREGRRASMTFSILGFFVCANKAACDKRKQKACKSSS